ncbi:MAG: toprim domain-containing protein [Granulosicoccaceae bacterium]
MKLRDCQQHGPTIDNELFVVEGLSAAANIDRGRDSKTQAVLALQGKPVNAAKASRSRLEQSEELNALASALGCGTGANFQLSRLRYKRVILLFDPDADGVHCGALVQIYLHQTMPQLIEAGVVQLIRAPLMKVTIPGHDKAVITTSEQHYQRLREVLRQQGIEGHSCQRYKGVASLDIPLLQEQCLQHGTRQARTLSLEDTLLAVEVFGS